MGMTFIRADRGISIAPIGYSNLVLLLGVLPKAALPDIPRKQPY